jgi:LysM repeat protein
MNENSVLKIGQNLYLYNPESPKVETVNDNQTTGKIYVVKQGDTLSKIAKENNVSLKSVLESNNLKENSRLQIGQKIVLSQNLAKKKLSSLNRQKKTHR